MESEERKVKKAFLAVVIAMLLSSAAHAEITGQFKCTEKREPLGTWRITAYAYTGSPCANGNFPTAGYTIAHNSLPFGTEVYIEGVGYRTVEDRGPEWLGSEWCDLYLGDTDSCIQWGGSVPRGLLSGGYRMTAVFRLKSFAANEIDSLISVMTKNGYKVIFEKGDRVSTKVIIRKDGQEYLSEREDFE